MIRFTVLVILCQIPIWAFGQDTAAAPKPVTLKDSTYSEVDQTVAGFKGKVVVVDVWSIYCIPCKKRFPHIVALHEKFEKSGLAVISLSSDDTEDRAKCLAFLKEKNATMTNLFLLKLPKPTKELDEKFPTDVQPALLFFDRNGKQVKKFDGDAKEKEIDETIEKLLNEK